MPPGKTAFSISPDGKQFACLLTKQGGNPGCDVGLRDVETSKLLRRIPIELKKWLSDQPSAFAFSRDGSLLAVGLTNGSIFVCETSGEGTPREFNGHNQAVRCLEFAADGKTLISGSDDTTATVWKLDKIRQ
jgi:WD40 repeat protein